MSDKVRQTDSTRSKSGSLGRRTFLKMSGGFALGGIAGLGMDMPHLEAATSTLKIAGTRAVPSVCPYCAVGCGQLVHVKGGRIINIEGNPDSPINRGTLCPKGAATFQLVMNPLRLTKVKYRRSGGTEWEEKSLEWAMETIAERVKNTRDSTFVGAIEPSGPLRSTDEVDSSGNAARSKPSSPLVGKVVNHTLAIASLGGATMDNEWNYVQAKLMRALGVVFIENQARI
jgi:formate dehydrogenase major subunit